jgi:hypothetical protein
MTDKTDNTNIGRKRALELTVSDVLAAIEDNARLDAEKAEFELNERRFRAYNDGVIKCTPVSFFVLHHISYCGAYFVSEQERDAEYDLCLKACAAMGITTATERIFKRILPPQIIDDFARFKTMFDVEMQRERANEIIANEINSVCRNLSVLYVSWRGKTHYACVLDKNESVLRDDLYAAVKDTYPSAAITTGSVSSLPAAELVDFAMRGDGIKGEVEKVLAKLRAQAQAE